MHKKSKEKFKKNPQKLRTQLTSIHGSRQHIIPKAKMYFAPLNTFTVTTWETPRADEKYVALNGPTDQFVGSVKVS